MISDEIVNKFIMTWQVVLLNEHSESRTIKLGLHLSEPCIDMEIVSSSEQSKHKQDSFLLLGKSGHVYAYDDCLIEKYLLQCQSRSPPSLPKEVKLKMPFADSSITIAKLITDDTCLLSPADEVEIDSMHYFTYFIWLFLIVW